MPYLATRNIQDIDVFEDYMAIEGREDGLTRVWLMDMAPAVGGATGKLPDPATWRQVEFKDDLYEAGTSVNLIWNTKKLRLVYSSLATPYTWYNLDMSAAEGGLEVLKVKPVLNFDGALYETRRVFAKAPDDTLVPISLVYRKDLFESGKQKVVPTMLYGYGSYGARFSPWILLR
jgi:oligopeptidase B